MGFTSQQVAKARREMDLPAVDEIAATSGDGQDGSLSSEKALLITTASVSSIGLLIGLSTGIIRYLSVSNTGYGRFFWVGIYAGLVAALWYAVQREVKKGLIADKGLRDQKLVTISRFGYVSALAIFMLCACLPVLYVLALIILVSVGLGVVGASMAWSWLVS